MIVQIYHEMPHGKRVISRGGKNGSGLTAAHRAAFSQGRYMGTMRDLPAAKMAIVKKIRAEKGISLAIRGAERRMVG